MPQGLAYETPMLRDNPNLRSGAEVLDAAFVTGTDLRVDGGRLARM